MNRLSCENPGDFFCADEILGRGGIVAIPTETVYGLAADARNRNAVRKIFSAKGRPLMDPLIVHFYEYEQVLEYCHVPSSLKNLAKAFWPGPLTVVLPLRPHKLDPIVSAGLPTLAVRIPAHPALRQLLSLSKRPLAAPSANPFGYISPTRADHVLEQLGEKIDAILDGGPCQHGLESTILSLANGENAPTLLRPGPVSQEELEEVLQHPVTAKTGSSPSRPEAPGLLDQHYSPDKPLYLRKGTYLENLTPKAGQRRLFLQRPAESSRTDTYWLSETGDPKEIAQNLFHLLRTLDSDEETREIHVEFPHEEGGIYPALRDRLRRAAHKSVV